MGWDRGALRGPTWAARGPSPWPHFGPDKSGLVSLFPAPGRETAEVSLPWHLVALPSLGLRAVSGLGAALPCSTQVSLEITLKTYNLEKTLIHFSVRSHSNPRK